MALEPARCAACGHYTMTPTEKCDTCKNPPEKKAPFETGGPAFPQPISRVSIDSPRDFSDEFGFGGMTLRDYLAAHCPIVRHPDDSLEQDARVRYKWADAMLEAREE